MIKAVITKSHNGYSSFECKGHSGYAEAGSDIICSAVSILTTTLLNSIEVFTECKLDEDVDDGYIKCIFVNGTDEKATLLVDAMILGLKSIQDIYGKKYLTLKIEEV